MSLPQNGLANGFDGNMVIDLDFWATHILRQSNMNLWGALFHAITWV